MWGSRQWRGQSSQTRLIDKTRKWMPFELQGSPLSHSHLPAVRFPPVTIAPCQIGVYGPVIRMASFFDIKARKAAAANGAGKQEKKTSDTPRAQPWVEK